MATYIGKWRDVEYRFDIFQNKNFPKRNNLVSVSLFFKKEVDNVYAKQKVMTLYEIKNDYEKKKKQYLRGLSNLVKLTSQKYNLQVFCDDSSYEEVSKYLTYSHIQIVKYEFNQFKVKGEHFGFFGTLMRLLPLFGLSYDNWETICVLDLDITFKQELIEYFLLSDAELMFWSRPCYYLSPRMYYLNKGRHLIICSFLIQRGVKNGSIFIDYLNDIMGDGEYIKDIRKYLPVDPDRRPFKGGLEYGTDEYFLNKIYLGMFESYDVVLYREIIGGILEWFKNIRFTNPVLRHKKEINEVLYKIKELFFMRDLVLPWKMKTEDKVVYLMEKFYELDLQYRYRNVDHKSEIIELMEFLGEDRYKKIYLYEELMYGLRQNLEIEKGYFNIYRLNGEKILMDVLER